MKETLKLVEYKSTYDWFMAMKEGKVGMQSGNHENRYTYNNNIIYCNGKPWVEGVTEISWWFDSLDDGYRSFYTIERVMEY